MNRLKDEIVELLDRSFEDYDEPFFPDGGAHVAIAVLDLLKIVVLERDRHFDAVYRIDGDKVMRRIGNNDVTILEKKYSEYADYD